MAYKKYQRKGKPTTVKRKTRTKRRKPAPPLSGPLMSAFPRKLKFKHRYQEIVTISSTTGVIGSYKFKCNGMYDPNTTETGHQPYYFDQLSSLYGKFTVIGSRIRVVATPSTALSGPVQVSIQKDDNGTVPSYITTAAEFSGRNNVKLLAVLNSDPAVLTSNWSLKKTFPGANITGSNFYGISTQDPNEQTSWVISVQSLDGSTEAITCMVSIEYIAIWWELQTIDGS